MIDFVLEPYRMFAAEELPHWSAKTFNNPCRYMHSYNNYWTGPTRFMTRRGSEMDSRRLCGKAWRRQRRGLQSRHALQTPRTRRVWLSPFCTHEAYHEVHHMLVNVYLSAPTGWMQESGASFAFPAQLFAGVPRYMASVALAPAWAFELSGCHHGRN